MEAYAPDTCSESSTRVDDIPFSSANIATSIYNNRRGREGGGGIVAMLDVLNYLIQLTQLTVI